jgi:hypothetical protein
VRAPIFTAEFVEQQGSAAIAALLDRCFYDLVRAEINNPIVKITTFSAVPRLDAAARLYCACGGPKGVQSKTCKLCYDLSRVKRA